MPEWLPVLIEGGSLALLAYIIVVTAPTILKETRAEREAREQGFTETLDKINAGFNVRAEVMAAAIDRQTAAIAKQTETLQAILSRQTELWSTLKGKS